MLFLASTFDDDIRAAMRSGVIGQLLTPDVGNRLEPGVPWATDNGCFSDRWKPERWLSFLDRYRNVSCCLFAVVPDVVSDHQATLRRFVEWSQEVRDRGYPVAFVGQDGATVDTTPWDDFDVWFAGGSTKWKLGAAYDIHAEAKRRGKWTHMGRVNSERRFRAAANAGYDSCDGTFLAFGPKTNLPKLLRWIQNHEFQPSLLMDRQAIRLG